jgi:rubredoxin
MTTTTKQKTCTICGFVYEEKEGWPEDSIAPGTCWEDIPEDWECPDCGAAKIDFTSSSHKE